MPGWILSRCWLGRGGDQFRPGTKHLKWNESAPCGRANPSGRESCLPGEDGELRLDDLDPDDDEEQGADGENDELHQRLEDSVGEPCFALQDLAQRLQQRGQRKLGVEANAWVPIFNVQTANPSEPYPLGHKDLMDAADPNNCDSLLFTQRGRSHQNNRESDGGPHCKKRKEKALITLDSLMCFTPRWVTLHSVFVVTDVSLSTEGEQLHLLQR